VRQLPSVNKKKVKTHPNYERTRVCNEHWAKATKYVKIIYHLSPREVREHGLYGKLVGMFYKALYGGKTVIEAIGEVEEVMVQRIKNTPVCWDKHRRFTEGVNLLKEKEGH
jgi:DNA-binding ferritin-like protein (Dps family)